MFLTRRVSPRVQVFSTALSATGVFQLRFLGSLRTLRRGLWLVAELGQHCRVGALFGFEVGDLRGNFIEERLHARGFLGGGVGPREQFLMTAEELPLIEQRGIDAVVPDFVAADDRGAKGLPVDLGLEARPRPATA